MKTDSLNFSKLAGLVPAVVQDDSTGTVLMVGFMNREAVERTLRDGIVTFWSRTKQRLWKKGETSGNILKVVSVDADCDGDSLLIRAIPAGPVCHTGQKSCFGETAPRNTVDVFDALAKVIRQRHATMPPGSYTAELFRAGTAQIAKKVGEEAVEVALSALEDDPAHFRRETADLFYHLLVLLEEKGVTLEEISGELRGRSGSG